MNFWDSSAVVPLVLDQPRSADLRRVFRGDRDMFLWWSTPVECASAIARAERAGEISASSANAALGSLRAIHGDADEIAPLDDLRDLAARLLRSHPLRAADALQLAAATLAAGNETRSLGFVCLDSRLASAAEREGFAVIR